MLRSILVALDESPWSEAATSLALEWAARFGARLVGLGIVDTHSIMGPEFVSVGATEFKRRRDEARIADANKRVAGVLDRFRSRCAEAGIQASTLKDSGDSAESILRQAHRCDLILLGRETYFHFETQDEPDETLGQVLRRSPRPTVVVPRESPTGNGVIVAYGGGREVARTLQTFQLLGLAGGEMTHLISIQRDEHKNDGFVQLAAEFLKSHGARHQLHIVETKLGPAQALLEQVRSLQPRLLVMGAHGHHPVRNLFATSVTRAVLRDCPVPVLVGA
jgi:nucleotide-binding universal stress UspA family protein